MNNPITLTFQRADWVNADIGKVTIGYDWRNANGVCFKVHWNSTDDTDFSTFLMSAHKQCDGDIEFVVTQGVNEIATGYIDDHLNFIFRAGDVVRESAVSPFVAAAQVIYTIS